MCNVSIILFCLDFVPVRNKKLAMRQWLSIAQPVHSQLVVAHRLHFALQMQRFALFHFANIASQRLNKLWCGRLVVGDLWAHEFLQIFQVLNFAQRLLMLRLQQNCIFAENGHFTAARILQEKTNMYNNNTCSMIILFVCSFHFITHLSFLVGCPHCVCARILRDHSLHDQRDEAEIILGMNA